MAKFRHESEKLGTCLKRTFWNKDETGLIGKYLHFKKVD